MAVEVMDASGDVADEGELLHGGLPLHAPLGFSVMSGGGFGGG